MCMSPERSATRPAVNGPTRPSSERHFFHEDSIVAKYDSDVPPWNVEGAVPGRVRVSDSALLL